MTIQEARIKGDDEYSWFTYKGKSMNLQGRGQPVSLNNGDVFGVRYSSNKKDKRLVLEKLGLTKVFTLNPQLEQLLYKNHA